MIHALIVRMLIAFLNTEMVGVLFYGSYSFQINASASLLIAALALVHCGRH